MLGKCPVIKRDDSVARDGCVSCTSAKGGSSSLGTSQTNNAGNGDVDGHPNKLAPAKTLRDKVNGVGPTVELLFFGTPDEDTDDFRR